MARPVINTRSQIVLFPVRVERYGNRCDIVHVTYLTTKMADCCDDRSVSRRATQIITLTTTPSIHLLVCLSRMLFYADFTWKTLQFRFLCEWKFESAYSDHKPSRWRCIYTSHNHGGVLEGKPAWYGEKSSTTTSDVMYGRYQLITADISVPSAVIIRGNRFFSASRSNSLFIVKWFGWRHSGRSVQRLILLLLKKLLRK